MTPILILRFVVAAAPLASVAFGQTAPAAPVAPVAPAAANSFGFHSRVTLDRCALTDAREIVFSTTLRF